MIATHSTEKGRRTSSRVLPGIVAALGLALACMLPPTPAEAHPHVFVTIKSVVVYEPDGKVKAIRHAWTFDQAYSAFLSQGIEKTKDGKLTREALAELAKVNVESLADMKYFTVAKAAGKPVETAPPTDYYLEGSPEALTLNFTLPLTHEVSGKIFSLEVYDPTYFVAFNLADSPDSVMLSGAPAGCTSNAKRPKPAEQPQQKSLSEAFFENLGPDSTFGLQFANRVIIACP